MVSFTDAPVNSYSWTLGGIAVYAFAIKSLLSYRRTKNQVAKIYSWLSLWFGTALLMYGFPGFFTQDPSIIKYTYFSADILMQIALQFAIWLSWFIGFRAYLSIWYLRIIGLVLSVSIIGIEVMTSKVQLSYSPHILIYTDNNAVLILKSVMYVFVAVPMSYFLLRQLPNQSGLRAKFQSLVSGLIPFVVAGAAVSNNIFDKGSDTVQSALELSVFFAIFLLAQLPRPKRLT